MRRRSGKKTHLKRRSGQDETVPRVVVLRQRDGELGRGVLHAVTLVDDHVEPLGLGEEGSVLHVSRPRSALNGGGRKRGREVTHLDDILVRRQQHLKVTPPNLTLRRLPLRRRPLVTHQLYARRPFIKLGDPVGHGREGDDDEVRTGLTLLFDQVGDEGEGLDRFAETLWRGRKGRRVSME